ncbi:hypothetical protein POG77_06040 [Lactococcus petauri]|uniref:hypothetical protein n=3 Tax=Lactococcus petauri TaxID=1940789 RepID=UPI001E3BF7ED|nr:hypothetical protein [Lactococcus petauri]MDC0808802.1 hypothetical protein [Lactococcus petauri]MDC0810945.1 hypothetical protein [Lactococcus petauri]MDC0823848.1 hypothetical protein [Lactococcus petauri]MDC0830514.1 hypothetical protein [Lactococcus petauri]MDQ7119937.1 hypothetical protein [Lactococcus petauri]
MEKDMKINTRKRKFTLASVVLLAAVSNMIVSQSVVEAVTTSIKNQLSNGEVVIYAQQAGPSSAAATGNAIGNNDGTQQAAGESSTSTATNNLTMSNVQFSATKITPTGAASAMLTVQVMLYLQPLQPMFQQEKFRKPIQMV